MMHIRKRNERSQATKMSTNSSTFLIFFCKSRRQKISINMASIKGLNFFEVDFSQQSLVEVLKFTSWSAEINSFNIVGRILLLLNFQSLFRDFDHFLLIIVFIMMRLLEKVDLRDAAAELIEMLQSLYSYDVEVLVALRTMVAVDDHQNCISFIKGHMQQFVQVQLEEHRFRFYELLLMLALE